MSDEVELSCKELVELVSGYLEGVLSDVERARFEDHLGECPGCATHLDQVRATIAAVGALRADDMEPAAREALLDAFRDWKRTGGGADGGL